MAFSAQLVRFALLTGTLRGDDRVGANGAVRFAHRHPTHCCVDVLREAVGSLRRDWPFPIDAFVEQPDPFHASRRHRERMRSDPLPGADCGSGLPHPLARVRNDGPERATHGERDFATPLITSASTR